jgi:hypothetical protein
MRISSAKEIKEKKNVRLSISRAIPKNGFHPPTLYVIVSPEDITGKVDIKIKKGINNPMIDKKFSKKIDFLDLDKACIKDTINDRKSGTTTINMISIIDPPVY